MIGHVRIDADEVSHFLIRGIAYTGAAITLGAPLGMAAIYSVTAIGANFLARNLFQVESGSTDLLDRLIVEVASFAVIFFAGPVYGAGALALAGYELPAIAAFAVEIEVERIVADWVARTIFMR